MTQNNGTSDASDFVHLHVHTEYSTLDGINRVNTLPEHIKSMGQVACSQTDHGTVAGTYSFAKSCWKAGIKPIIGMEAYYTVGDRTVKEKDADGQNYYHLVLLAKNNEGVHNLYKISSEAYTSGKYYKPRADDQLLADHSKGLIATSACLGSRASKLILMGRKTEAEKLILHHNAIFDDFLIEIQLHEDKDQQTVNKTLIDIAKRNNLPLVLTNDCHYTHEHHKNLHEKTLCMSTNAKMAWPAWDPERKLQGATGKTRFSFGEIDVHVAHQQWMWERAQRQGIPYEAIKNTRYVADMINDKDYFSDRINRYPRYQKCPDGMTSWQYLEWLSKEELMKKMGGMPPKQYRDRLNHELKVIKRMGFSDYILIVRDIIKDANNANIITGPGRGSAASSLVNYALGITHIDPLQYGLIFSRFLNEGRAATPKLLNTDLIQKIEKAQKPEGTVLCNHGNHSSKCNHKH